MNKPKPPLMRLTDLVRHQERPGADVDLYIVVGPGRASIGFGAPDDHDHFIPGVAQHISESDSAYLSLDDLAQGVLDDMAEKTLASHTQRSTAKTRGRR